MSRAGVATLGSVALHAVVLAAVWAVAAVLPRADRSSGFIDLALLPALPLAESPAAPPQAALAPTPAVTPPRPAPAAEPALPPLLPPVPPGPPVTDPPSAEVPREVLVRPAAALAPPPPPTPAELPAAPAAAARAVASAEGASAGDSTVPALAAAGGTPAGDLGAPITRGESGDDSGKPRGVGAGSGLGSGAGGSGAGSELAGSGDRGLDGRGEIPGASAPEVDTQALMGHLRRYLDYPSKARANGWEGKVSVSFRLGPDGRARSIRVVASSGFPGLDRSAMAAVRKASPFPSPPSREVVLVLPLTYSLR